MRGLGYELPRYQPKRRCASTARPAPTLPYKSPSNHINRLATRPQGQYETSGSVRDLRVSVDFFRKHISNTGITPKKFRLVRHNLPLPIITPLKPGRSLSLTIRITGGTRRNPAWASASCNTQATEYLPRGLCMTKWANLRGTRSSRDNG